MNDTVMVQQRGPRLQVFKSEGYTRKASALKAARDLADILWEIPVDIGGEKYVEVP